MTKKAFSLDWVRFTLPYGFQDNGSEPPSFIGGKTKACKPILSYNMAVENELHKICWHTEHPEFRVMVEITGSQLASARKQGSTDNGIISEAHNLGAKFTRIDFAVDLFDTEGSPKDIRECYHTNQLMTTSKTVYTLEKEAKKQSLGATVYIGARSSDRLIRVYDKGKQQNTNLDWIRVELETGGKRAMQFGEYINKHGSVDAGKAYLRDGVEWSDIEWFEDIWEGDQNTIDIDAIGRPETDRERWLRTVVIPVIERELETGSEWLFSALETLINEKAQHRGHNPVK